METLWRMIQALDLPDRCLYDYFIHTLLVMEFTKNRPVLLTQD